MTGKCHPIPGISIAVKLLECIPSINILPYFESLNFVYAYQHGSHKQRSFDTQLDEFTHDILVYMNVKLQIDFIFLDIKKTFHLVLDKHLL